MVQPNINNLINQYLYGQSTTTTNLTNDSLIRSKDATTEVEVDVVEFMATGYQVLLQPQVSTPAA